MLLFLFSFSGFVFGAVMGSFSTAIIHRIPLGQSFVFTRGSGAERSECPHCKHELSFLDLVPVFSWLLLRGRCRYCGVGVGTFYIYVEVFSACLGVVTMNAFGLSLWSLYLYILMPFLLSSVILFFRHRDFSMIKSLCLTMVAISVCAALVSGYVGSFLPFV